MVAHHFDAVGGFLGFGIQKFIYCFLVAFGRAGLQFVSGGAETGPAHQVGHQGYIVITHCF